MDYSIWRRLIKDLNNIRKGSEQVIECFTDAADSVFNGLLLPLWLLVNLKFVRDVI